MKTQKIYLVSDQRGNQGFYYLHPDGKTYYSSSGASKIEKINAKLIKEYILVENPEGYEFRTSSLLTESALADGYDARIGLYFDRIELKEDIHYYLSHWDIKRSMESKTSKRYVIGRLTNGDKIDFLKFVSKGLGIKDFYGVILPNLYRIYNRSDDSLDLYAAESAEIFKIVGENFLKSLFE